MRRARVLGFVLLASIGGAPLVGQQIPQPRDFFGFAIGEDRRLADWRQLTAWYDLLARRSARVTLDTLGRTTLGLPFVMLTVTSAGNHARLAELRDIQLKLADPRQISEPGELARLLDHGKTVVLVTHGIHATEVGSSQMAARLLHRLATSDDPEVQAILDDVILLDIPSLNPDGLRMIVEWYRRWVGTEYEAAPLPMLYHYYVGHDNNRDWYAFTQIETELTVTQAHNAWHPQIVHDIHQMGSTGPRIFFPPFIDPWDENIDPRITAAVSQLGAYMAAELVAQGKAGVAINAIYDAYTPARAYQHYHGGVRILSETASARLATPITLAPDDLSTRRGLNVRQRTWNFPMPWAGGTWRLSDIVEYMEAGVMALLRNAARNRRFWLENFYQINRSAVARWPERPRAWVIPGDQPAVRLAAVVRILALGDVEVHRAERAFEAGGRRFAAGSYVIPMDQPYAGFAQTLLERQVYPDLRLYPGGPPRPPYDVTAHTLPLLMGVEAVPVAQAVDVPLSASVAAPTVRYTAPAGLTGTDAPRIGVYKSWREPMPEGWTRWVFDRHAIPYDTLHDADIRSGALRRYDVLLFEDQSQEAIVSGWPADAMPEPYAGGLGQPGVDAVRQFVDRGGRLIAVGAATDFAVEALELAVSNAVSGLAPSDFYIPGSILGIELASDHPVAQGMPQETSAWYWRSSRAFEVADQRATVIGRFATGDPLRSGWALGQDRIAGRPAIVEVRVGRGSVVLFGVPPNYRGQTMATWPLLFNALNHRR